MWFDIVGRCWECDGCMRCQEDTERDSYDPEYDDWDIDEDLKRDREDYDG